MLTGKATHPLRGRIGGPWARFVPGALAAFVVACIASCTGGGGGAPAAPTGVSGDVLLVGGVDQFNGPATVANLFNPRTGTFVCGPAGFNSKTGVCNSALAQARFYMSVAPLPNGEVLIAGGNGAGVLCLNSAELFNPLNGTFTPTGSMTDAHCFAHTTTVLQNGEVLITGGEDQTGNLVNTADMYDPTTGQFECSGLGGADPNTGYCLSTLTDTRFLDTATLLQDGSVVIAGGNDGSIVNTAEIFDPVSGTFGCSSLGGVNPNTGFCNNTMTDSRQNHTATLIVTGPNAGDVLIAGGLDASGVVLQTAELFNPNTGTFVCSDGSKPGASGCAAAMTSARYLHTATLLAPPYVKGSMAGDILIAGGEDGSGTVLSSAEIYDPVAGTFQAVGPMTTSRALASAVLITSGPARGQVLIAGGVDDSGDSLNSAELFNPSTGKFTATKGAMTVARSSLGAAMVR
jgi:hypothetical protein